MNQYSTNKFWYRPQVTETKSVVSKMTPFYAKTHENMYSAMTEIAPSGRSEWKHNEISYLSVDLLLDSPIRRSTCEGRMLVNLLQLLAFMNHLIICKTNQWSQHTLRCNQIKLWRNARGHNRISLSFITDTSEEPIVKSSSVPNQWWIWEPKLWKMICLTYHSNSDSSAWNIVGTLVGMKHPKFFVKIPLLCQFFS